MATSDEDFERGPIVVSHGGRTTEVEATHWDYEGTGEFGTGNLRLWDGDTIVAEFRYWDSVQRKIDD